jgi:hypothetical protein
MLLLEYRRAKISSRSVFNAARRRRARHNRLGSSAGAGVRAQTAAPVAPCNLDIQGPNLPSPEYLVARLRSGQTPACRLWFLILDQYLPSPRPSGGSLVIIGPGTGCQGQWLFCDRRRRHNAECAGLVSPLSYPRFWHRQPAVPALSDAIGCRARRCSATGIASDQSRHPSPGSQRRWDGDDRRCRKRARWRLHGRDR